MDQFKAQTETYLKFLFYHCLIIFTLIFSLLNAFYKISDSDFVNKIKDIKTLAAELDQKPTTKDYLLNGMYFTDPADNKTDTAAKIILSDSLQKIKGGELKLKRKEVETITADAFLIKITFLGDIHVDLRYWIFVLPVFLIFSVIYIFILDYKIILLKHVYGNEINENQKHPFNFLRNLLLGIETLLIVTYIVVFFKFLSFGSPSLFNNILWVYILISYYSLLYCLFIKYKLRVDIEKDNYSHGFPELALSILLRNILKTARLFTYPKKYKLSIGITQALLISTLFLVMSNYSCNEEGGGEAKSQNTYITTDTVSNKEIAAAEKNKYVYGYQLLSTSHRWQSMGGGESDSFFGYFFKYLYMFVIIQTVFLSLFYKTRFKNTIYPPGTRLFKILTFCFYASLITSVIFSVYFANYYFLSTGDLDSILALLVLLHWFVFAGKKIITNHNNPNRLFLTSITSIIYFLPFIIGGLITCFKKYHTVNGWIFYYPGIWFMFFTCLFILQSINKKTALPEKIS